MKKKSFAEIKSSLPLPVFDEEPGWIDLYWKAWELAWDHVRHIPGMPQTPYMDEGFCDTDIWIWDTCFMTLFCKYAPQELFPGTASLKNFYHILHEKGELPRIRPERIPFFSGAKPGEEVPLLLHIADNPPLLAWAEYENALFSGDKEHLKDLLLDKQYLQKHYDFLESLSERIIPPGVRNETCLIREELGYLWEGGRSGMDNTPRGRTGGHAVENRPNNPDMLWLDAICQQALAANCISRMAKLIGDDETGKFWQERFQEKREIVLKYYWDDKEGFFFDIDRNTHAFYRILTPASFWPLTAEIANAEQAEKTVRAIEDADKLGGEYPWTSLSRSDADFNAENGMYWRGSVWLPTAYAGLRGCLNYGFFDQARQSSLKLLTQMYRTWQEYAPHTIWECYNPNLCEPARSCDENNRIVRPDFCGWSALGPISIFIECVIGIYSVNAFEKKIKWHLPEKITGTLGIKKLRFGTVTVDLLASQQEITIVSSEAFTLEVNSTEFQISQGSQTFQRN